MRLLRAVRSAFHWKTVKGRVQSLHSSPWSCLIICTKGLSGRQFSQTEGKSVVSHPERLRSCLICGGIIKEFIRCYDICRIMVSISCDLVCPLRQSDVDILMA